MLKRIDCQEIMTVQEAMNKYRDYYFRMVITEGDGGRNTDKGYVIYIYDDQKEMRNIPFEDYEGLVVVSMIGNVAEKGISIGNVKTFFRV